MTTNKKQNSFSGLGYLVWMKLPQEFLADSDLPAYLEADLSKESDESLQKLHAAKQYVEDVARVLSARGIQHLRTGMSWAEWVTPQGRRWIEWYMRKLAGRFEVLPNLTFTPPELGVESRVNAAPNDLLSYARFVQDAIARLGDCFTEVELWNEWDLITDWDPVLDPQLEKFSAMVALGAMTARHFGKRPVLGGMSGVKPQTLGEIEAFARKGAMRYFDAVGFHNLRGTWSDKVPPSSLSIQKEEVEAAASVKPDEEKSRAFIRQIARLSETDPELAAILRKEIARPRQGPISVYVTEYGFPTTDPEEGFARDYLEAIQATLFANCARLVEQGSVERIYWYTFRDLRSPSLRFATTGWEDVLQYFYGDTQENGTPKLLGDLLDRGGPSKVLEHVRERNLWHLVDAASLDRKMPKDYVSQSR